MSKELIEWAQAVSENRKIDFDNILEAVEEALAVSVRRKYEGERIFRVKLDLTTGHPSIYRMWKVCEEVQYPTKEISLEAALLENPNVQIGEYIEELLPEDTEIPQDRISLLTFRQMITSKIREFEKVKMIEAYKPYLGQIVTGKVRRVSATSIQVYLPDLDAETMLGVVEDEEVRHCDAVIRREGLVPNEKFRVNEPIKALLYSLDSDIGKQQIILTRAHVDFVRRILEREVPEIKRGDIQIVNIAREPGGRTKVAVKTDVEGLDAVGACIGPRSNRINAVVDELFGERVDIIQWTDNLVDYISNALCKPTIVKAIIDEKTKSVDVSVPQEGLSAAIGRHGINIRLASKLVGWKIRVHEKDSFEALREEKDAALIKYFEDHLGLDEESSKYLINEGFKSIEEIAGATLEELDEFLDRSQAMILQTRAQSRIDEILNEQVQLIKDSGIDQRILDLPNITNDMVIKLIGINVKTLEDLADLATDELHGLMARHRAEQIIMSARQICWFNNEITEEVSE